MRQRAHNRVLALGAHFDMLVGDGNLIEQMRRFGAQPFDPRIMFGGEAVDQPSANGVDPLNLAEVESVDPPFISAQPFREIAEAGQRQSAGKAQRFGATDGFVEKVGFGGHWRLPCCNRAGSASG